MDYGAGWFTTTLQVLHVNWSRADGHDTGDGEERTWVVWQAGRIQVIQNMHVDWFKG